MNLSTEEIEKLIEKETNHLDRMGEETALRMTENLQKRREAAENSRFIWLTVSIFILWISFRQIFTLQQYAKLQKWWEQREDPTFGYQHGNYEDKPDKLTSFDVIMQIEFPVFRKGMELFFASSHISTEGAYFLNNVISMYGKDRKLLSVHWKGSDIDPKDFLGDYVYQERDCIVYKKKNNLSKNIPWHDVMLKWSAQVVSRTGEHVLAPFRVKNGSVSFLPTEGRTYLNPWASMFGFEYAVELPQNNAIVEYMCATDKSKTVLSILFRGGLVGIATELEAINITASEMHERLFGAKVSKKQNINCEAINMQKAFDVFAIGSGMTSAAITTYPILAGMGTLASAGAAYYTYSSQKSC